MAKNHFLPSYERVLLSILLLFILTNPLFSNSYGDPMIAIIKKGEPVWVAGREKEMNLTLGFRSVFQAKNNQNTSLRITASTLYRVYLNGEYLGYGPARAGHGFFRVDEYDLSKRIKDGSNILAIEVAGYNVNSYYTIDQPSFLQAEVESEGKILLATGNNGNFDAFQIRGRLQKVERYSFQRPFSEFYRLKNGFDKWKTDANIQLESVKTSICKSGKLLSRNLILPDLNIVHPVSLCAKGTIQYKKPYKYYKDRSLRLINDKYKGYKETEPEELPSQIIQELSTKTLDSKKSAFSDKSITLTANEFITYDLGIDLTGFIGAVITCQEPVKLYFHFDEVLTDGDVNTKKRMPDVNNQVVYELEPGTYNLETFEPYTFKYLKAILVKGTCKIEDVYLRKYACHDNPNAYFVSSNNILNEIYKASRQSFRQNAVDILTDCPSRERAGWLCDSYFSAIMEKDFTGHSAVAHNFYENYALPDSFAFLPKGMIPMCYPADHNDGVFIPNWAMWFVVQVNDYAHRGGDPNLIARLKPRIEGILNYFSKFENGDGLLENLDSWIFVEWSRANDFTKDVNYPSNMLYSAVLSSAADLYNNENWRKKSESIKKTIVKQSYNGSFFADNAIRNKSGKLEVTKNTTEVCQYYAFYFDVASTSEYPELWKKLTTEFGPNRNDKMVYPNVFRANAFVGNYMRMDILSRNGLKNQLMNEIQDYFYYMAQRTGTLWENMGSEASCNHGFASYIGHVLYRDVLGIKNIDYLNKEITIEFTDNELKECKGAVPINGSSIDLKWSRTGKTINYSVTTPPEYKLKVENHSLSELKRIE